MENHVLYDKCKTSDVRLNSIFNFMHSYVTASKGCVKGKCKAKNKEHAKGLRVISVFNVFKIETSFMNFEVLSKCMACLCWLYCEVDTVRNE